LDFATENAAAVKAKSIGLADAALAKANAIWPALVTYVQAEAPAIAARASTIATAYGTYQTQVASAGVTQVNAIAPAAIQKAADISAADKAFNVGGATNDRSRNVAAAELELAKIQASAACNFAGIAPTEPVPWYSLVWNFVSSLGITLLLGIAAIAVVAALICAGAISAPFAAVAGLVLLAGMAAVMALNRFAAGQSIGESILGGLADATGVSNAYGAATGRDLATQENLHLTAEQRASMAGAAVGEVILAVVGPKIKFCFVAGTKVLLAEGEDGRFYAYMDGRWVEVNPDDIEVIEDEPAVAANVDYAMLAFGATCIAIGAGGLSSRLVGLRRKDKYTFANGVDAVLSDEDFDDLFNGGMDHDPDDDFNFGDALRFHGEPANAV